MITPEQAAWLTGPKGAQHLRHGLSYGDAFRRIHELRKKLPASQAALVCEMLELRERARDKFSRAAEMFFEKRALEQSTDERIARYKARRFPREQAVADLCCGIGGDLMALAERGFVHAADLNPVLVAFAQANVAAGTCDVYCDDALKVPLGNFAAWHVDPDRRSRGRRTSRPETAAPSAQQLQPLLAQNPHAGIKLAPAASDQPLGLHADQAEREWVGHGRHCHQQLLWTGDLARHRGLRAATILDRSGNVLDQVVGADQTATAAHRVLRYVMEPHAVVIAAGLVGQLAADAQLAVIDPRTVYLTGDTPATSSLWSCFEVREVMPFDRKKVRQRLQSLGIGRLEVKTRGLDVSANALQIQLRAQGTKSATLIVTRLLGRVTCLLADRYAAT